MGEAHLDVWSGRLTQTRGSVIRVQKFQGEKDGRLLVFKLYVH